MPRHSREPYYKKIKTWYDIAKVNTSSVSSTLRGGAYSLLGLTLVQATYQNFTGHLFVREPDLGHAPTILYNSTAVQILAIVC